jgi:hypothetical protein
MLDKIVKIYYNADLKMEKGNQGMGGRPLFNKNITME